jgi:hypothetical protein
MQQYVIAVQTVWGLIMGWTAGVQFPQGQNKDNLFPPSYSNSRRLTFLTQFFLEIDGKLDA